MLTKEQIKQQIIPGGRPVQFKMSLLKYIFGFYRVDGKAFMLLNIVNTSITEQQASMCSPQQTKKNIESWCNEENILYQYNCESDSYLFLRK